MRFLLGLIAGAGVVLLVAAGAGDPGWRDRADAALQILQTRATDAWHRATAEVAAAKPGRTREEVAVAAPAPASARKPPSGPPVEAPPNQPPPQQLDAAGPGRPEQPAEPALTAVEPPERPAAAASASDAVADEPPPSAVPIPRPPDPEPVDRTEALSGVQRVWVPFHSQMSAAGFAARLSESLDHPFRVERRGPRSYQVVFPYRSEPERQALLAQAADATGLPL